MHPDCCGDTYTHQGTEHVYSSMCHSIVVPFKSLYCLYSQLFSEPETQYDTFGYLGEHLKTQSMTTEIKQIPYYRKEVWGWIHKGFITPELTCCFFH